MMSKPDTCIVMQDMIEQIREIIPFNTPQEDLCAHSESCQGCSLKLLEFLEAEIDGWQNKLDDGVKPGFSDLSRLEKAARSVYRVLERNGVVKKD
jgi:cob(I)alamin adenosyltransferase